MDKAPILKDDQIQDWFNKNMNSELLISSSDTIARAAQRDSDHDYYIIEIERLHKNIERLNSELESSYYYQDEISERANRAERQASEAVRQAQDERDRAIYAQQDHESAVRKAQYSVVKGTERLDLRTGVK